MKPTKFAIAVALYHPVDKSKVLAVKRPANDDSLPNVWGLPAVVVKEGELPEDAVKCKQGRLHDVQLFFTRSHYASEYCSCCSKGRENNRNYRRQVRHPHG